MKIAIVGGGNGGAAILKTLNKMDKITIVGVMDIDQNAPGIRLAKELNIFYTNSIQKLLENKIDIIIEATGVQKVRDEISNIVEDNSTIMCSMAANLMMMLVENEEELLNKIEKQVKQVEELSEVTVHNIEQINDTIENTGDLSETLNEFAAKTMDLVNETNKIIQTMASITQQTHILGLNASIEAARAGEQGKGFTVVAKEVQKLANNTSEFTKQIGTILNTINHEVVNVSNEIGQLNNVVEKQKQVGRNLEDAVNILVSNIHKI